MGDSSTVVGYAGAISVAHGEPLVLHPASRAPIRHCAVDVYRVVGCVESRFRPRMEFVTRADDVPVFGYGADDAAARLGPGDADVYGCAWPGVPVLHRVPDDWPSGLYLAQFTNTASPTGAHSSELGQDTLFIVRPRLRQPHSPALVQLPAATWNAYHIWQNRNLYIGDVGDPSGDDAGALRAHRVSFHRPGIGLAPRSNITVFPPTAFMYVLPFLQWTNEVGLELDFCAGTDIAMGAIELAAYRVVVTIGHDEYWSGPQRDRLEAYVAGGGNAAFFGGNLSYWQIRLADDGHAVECYKRAADPITRMGARGLPLDPRYRDPDLHPGHDNSDVTVEFHASPVFRSPVAMTGVSMRNDEGGDRSIPVEDRVHCGAAWWWENYRGPERPAKGFTVVADRHWALEGTGLRHGDEFGVAKKLVGFECDGLDVDFDEEGLPGPTHRDGSPTGVTIIAFADCRDWAETDYAVDPPETVVGRRLNNAAFGGVVTMVEFVSARGGRVFTAPVTDWTHALVDLEDYTEYRRSPRPIITASQEVRVITANVFRRLGAWTT